MLVPEDERSWSGEPTCHQRTCQVTDELELRVRELDCLFGISRLVERSEGNLEAILQGTAELLPSSFEHPDTTCARIVLDSRSFTSANFASKGTRQTVELRVNGEGSGRVEVWYRDKDHPPRGDPFLPSEYELLEVVAERLGHVVERIRAQQALRQHDLELREDLAHLTRVVVMGEMASMIAHEVNQPLTAIANYAHACHRLISSRSIDTDETLSTLTRIGEEAIRAGAIVHSMKDLSRKRHTEREESDINKVISDIEPLAQVDARLHEVNLRLELDDSLPKVTVDRVQVQQVVINLVRNGIDAMAETPVNFREIVISTGKTVHGDIEVRVADCGCGIPLTERERLYESFYTTKKSGMGMGLSVSRTIMAAHGGQLGFTDNPEGGTIFYFSFPPTTGDINES